MATRASTLAWEIPGQRSLAGCSLWSHKEQDTTECSTAGVSELCEPPPHFCCRKCECDSSVKETHRRETGFFRNPDLNGDKTDKPAQHFSPAAFRFGSRGQEI